jgi:protein SCO1/2
MSNTGRPLLATLAVAVFAGCAVPGTAAPDFTLIADSGQPWTLSAQRGRPVLLTFGFTHCADTCPATLARLTRLTQSLGTRGSRVEIAMMTVDPQRDTPPVMHSFVARFGGPIVGLTGTPAHVGTVEDAYHVYAQRIPGKHPRVHDYDVAHSAVIYAIDSHGNVRAIRNDDDSDATLTGTVRELLQ